jgi:hypothetical protein
VEIGQYDVEFIPQWAIKSQALETSLQNGQIQQGIDELPDHWVMYFDGFYTLNGAGAGVVVIAHEGDVFS